MMTADPVNLISGMTVLPPLAQLFPVLAAQPFNLSEQKASEPFLGVTTDSRHVLPGQLFVALQGDRFDGHNFVATALQQGAVAAIVSRLSESSAGLPLLKVSDTMTAYQAIAHWWRGQFTVPVIAVTGSVGKTTTKELIAAVMATQGKVLKTQANYNNEIGVPKTLLELTPDHDFAVIEMGMRAAGEIAELARIAHPTVAVITNVGTAHIGRLGSEEAIASAKCELLAEIPADGIAVLNYDNLRLMDTARKVWQGKVLTYGLTGGDLHGQIHGDRLLLDGMEFPLPLPGQHNASNYLAALAVAKVLGVPWEPLQQGLTVTLLQGRARREWLPNDVLILDETYNAGLESMIAALHLLAETPGQRHIAVLGTMKELGERSPEFHFQVGEVVRQLKLDHLLILADKEEARAMAAGASPLVAEQFANHAEVVERLKGFVQRGDRLLLKASRAVGLDRVLEQFRNQWKEN